ncbi:hypothetical protein [Ferruginibacter sp. HRS2-29]|uniref:hypothetical protein n=1 Tax=Ferruginibacter sp. HRS2-29 TaxID=2487334 RepID=UPI0020CF8D94|nr:hypothetical protein [Ferruginibacter sp. HRS2-29]MCP9752735.1 hypothetical protein [Ferruginibacter sp. HRS2-29]
MMQIAFRIFHKNSLVLIFSLLAKILVAQPMPPLPANQLVLPGKSFSIPLYWKADLVGTRSEPHAALLVPVKLPGCPKQFYMQFDLGLPYSLFYKNKLTAIHARYPGTKQWNDTSGKLVNFSFKVGSTSILAKEMPVQQFDSSSIEWKNKKAVEIIGTIGADLIDGKVAVIDYPNKKLVLADTIPGEFSGMSFSGFIYASRRVLLPATIGGKQTLLYFDTGSSMYELLTNKTSCEALAIPGSELVQNKVWSWNKYLVANTRASNDSVFIGGKNVRLHSTTYIDGVSATQAEQMQKMGIGGMTGNKLFLEYKLVLDTKNKKFGLMQVP